MATVVRREVRKRGFFGWVFLLLFLAFNAFMLTTCVAGMSSLSRMQTGSAAEEAGRAIGATIGLSMIMFIWLAGAIILGLIALLTRGSTTVITETTHGEPDMSRWSHRDRQRVIDAEAQRVEPLLEDRSDATPRRVR